MQLVLVPGHWDEKAELNGSMDPSQGPEAAVWISPTDPGGPMEVCFSNEIQIRRNVHCVAAPRYYKCPDEVDKISNKMSYKLSPGACSFKRSSAKKLKLSDDYSCRKCQEEKETVYLILRECEAVASEKPRLLESPFIRPGD